MRLHAPLGMTRMAPIGAPPLTSGSLLTPAHVLILAVLTELRVDYSWLIALYSPSLQTYIDGAHRSIATNKLRLIEAILER